MKKIVVFLSKKSVVKNSWVWKYWFLYYENLKDKYEIELFYQPENTGILWRFFVLNRIIKNKYNQHVKIFTDENFLPSLRKNIAVNSVVIVHHYPFLTKVTNLKEYLVKILSWFSFKKLRYIDAIVTVSDFTYTTLTQTLWIDSKKIKIIQNPIDHKTYFPLWESDLKKNRDYLSRKFDVNYEKSVILFVWSDESRKNFQTVIRALNNVENTQLIRIWKKVSPAEWEKIQSLLACSDIDLLTLENVDELDLIKFYQTSNIFVFPSLFEWFWRPPIEAQACGCPVISTHSWALGEVIWESAFILKNPIDHVALRNLIIFVLKNSESKDSYVQKGVENANRFWIIQNLIRWEELLNQQINS